MGEVGGNCSRGKMSLLRLCKGQILLMWAVQDTKMVVEAQIVQQEIWGQQKRIQLKQLLFDYLEYEHKYS